MITAFDYFGYPEKPYIILCNPNQDELYSLEMAYDTKLDYRFNAVSEFSFTFPESIDGGTTTLDGYDYLQNKRLVKVENFGFYIITNVEEVTDGAVPLKNVSCKSQEFELVSKRLSGYPTYNNGTVKLWDTLAPTHTILYDIVTTYAPTWSVGTVDGSLTTKYRTFDVADSNVYNFLMEDCEKAFDCVFIFDTENKEISAFSTGNATLDTDIYLSFENLIKDSKFSEKSDEITTALYCYGEGGITIRDVNPLGTNAIYDFSYYEEIEWMSQSLIDALDAWEALVDSKQSDYSDLIVIWKGHLLGMAQLETELAVLQATYEADKTTQKVRIEQGLSLNSAFDGYPSGINYAIAEDEAAIAAKNIEIGISQGDIDDAYTALGVINDQLSFATNFTEAQYLELSNFIYENTFKNQYAVVSENATPIEEQEMSETLYDQGIAILEKIAQPRYEMEISTVNFLAVKNFDTFARQLTLGATAITEVKPEVYATTVLLEIHVSFDNPEDFSLTFSNRLRLDGPNYMYSDLMGAVQKTGSKVSFGSAGWADWSNNYKDSVSTFITSSLDATLNNLINGVNQEIIIDGLGLRGRNGELGAYSDNQVWLTSNTLAFTRNAWSSAGLAIGEIENPSIEGGPRVFGVVADAIVGRLIAGEELVIANESLTFVVNATGATLTNGAFNLITGDYKSLIAINPEVGIRIASNPSGNPAGTYTDVMWIDSSGNANFSGNLVAATGTFSGTLSAGLGEIGGWTIAANGLVDNNGSGNYILSDGHVKLGALTIDGAIAEFTGTIRADRLQGQISWSQLIDVPTNSLNVGGGGQIRFSGFSLGTAPIPGINVNPGLNFQITTGWGNIVNIPGYFQGGIINTLAPYRFNNHQGITKSIVLAKYGGVGWWALTYEGGILTNVFEG